VDANNSGYGLNVGSTTNATKKGRIFATMYHYPTVNELKNKTVPRFNLFLKSRFGR
jgi:hypothetical protein